METITAMDEIWKDIPGWEGFYAVSDLGRVKALARVVPHAHVGEYRLRECIRKPQPNKGYPTVILRRGERIECWFVHSLVLLAFVGARPVGTEARHLDGDPANPRLDNICYGTPRENQADRVLHGTSNRGTRQWKAKLQPEDVLKIRKLALTVSQSDIANRFGVTRSNISMIITRRSWAWLWETFK